MGAQDMQKELKRREISRGTSILPGRGRGVERSWAGSEPGELRKDKKPWGVEQGPGGERGGLRQQARTGLYDLGRTWHFILREMRSYWKVRAQER